MQTMLAVVYPPPQGGLPYIAVIFHTDRTIALSKPFTNAADAQQYILDVRSSLVTAESQLPANEA